MTSQTQQTSTDKKSTRGKPRTSTSRPTRSLRWIKWLIGFVLLAVLLIAYYWVFQSKQVLQDHMATTVSQLDSQATALQTISRELNQQIGQFQQGQHDLRSQMNSLQQQLSRQQRQLASLSTLGRDDWLLAEAQYLMRLANQRLLASQDIAGTQDLLQAADNILRQLDDAALYPVRQALAEEIAALNTADHVDSEGIYFQLAALAKQVAQLRLFEPPGFSADQSEAETTSVSQARIDDPSHSPWRQRWQASLKAAWQKLGHAVSIQRHDDMYKPNLSPMYVASIGQTLQLLFVQAQTALLLREQTLFDASLADIITWLDNYYTLNPSATEAIIASINQLKQQHIIVVIPDISSSLHELKQFMDSAPTPSEPIDQPTTLSPTDAHDTDTHDNSTAVGL